MDLFIDSADINELRAAAATGLIDGCTTNPSLIAKSGRKMAEAIKEICSVIPGPVSAEAVATDVDGMIAEGRYLAKLAPNVVVKLPLTENGLKACRVLSEEGTNVNVTLCFSAVQALLAAKAGAYFISPFIGRLDDNGIEGMDLIREIRAIYDNYAFTTRILAKPCARRSARRRRLRHDPSEGLWPALQTHPHGRRRRGFPERLEIDRSVDSLGHERRRA
jgi:transaldolase